MKKALPFIALLFLPLALHADGEKTLFMLTNFSSARRTPIAVQVPQLNSSQRGPVFDLTQRNLWIPQGRLQMSRLSGISFELRVVDGVAEVNTAADEKDFNVYSIDGRLVRTHATSLDGLAKGLYIVKGKKILVK